MKQRVVTVMILIRVDAGIKLSLLNWRDSGNESVLVVKRRWAGISSIIKDRSILVDIVDIRTEKIGRPRRDSCCCEM